jgi:biopolymer transport protein ExbD
MKYYHYLFYCLLLSFINCDSKHNEDVKKKFIVLSVSPDEKIYYDKDEIKYCDVNNKLKPILGSDTISNSCIELHPDVNVNMHFIKCLIYRKLKGLGIDSIRLWKKAQYITIKIDKDKFFKGSESIFIHFINKDEISLNDKRISKNKFKEEIRLLLKKDNNYVFYLSFKKGVSYTTYIEFKKMIEQFIDKYKNSDNFKITLVEDNCPSCP